MKSKERRRPAKRNAKEARETIEKMYEEILRPQKIQTDTQSLKQPSGLRVVDTVTTYGAYEEPIERKVG